MMKLDEIALSVELVLVSLIESVALTFLAEHAIPALQSDEWYKYLPYILSGLAIILVFWAQSILHAVSFIRWPIHVGHMFLYFIAAFVQILTYGSIEHIQTWFLWSSLFSAIAIAMYMADLQILRETRPAFAAMPHGGAFIEEVERRHLYEMKVLVPLAFIFNIFMLCLTFVAPALFASPLMYAIPGTLQLLVSIGAIYDCVKNFRARSTMILQMSPK